METKHITTAATLKTAGSEAGSIEAAFVRFDNRDRDGDVILASAFTDGQEVIMTWAHDWTKPIGKGRVRVERDRAVFSGQLWTDTHDGEQAYRRIKNAGNLQQYSWGFQILDSDRGDFKGERSRFIRSTELFEVSPVLIGAAGTGNTATLSVKHARLTPAEVAEIEAIRRSVDTGMLFEVERARALGVAVKQPSQYHLLTTRQQLAIEVIHARKHGVRV